MSDKSSPSIGQQWIARILPMALLVASAGLLADGPAGGVFGGSSGPWLLAVLMLAIAVGSVLLTVRVLRQPVPVRVRARRG